LFRVYIVKFWESRAHTRAGDAGRGRTLAEEGFALAERIGTKFVLAQGKVSLAEALLALGEVDEACRVCREAIILSEESGDAFGAAIAHRTLAESLIRLHPPDSQWQREILEAIRLQRDRGAQPELARSASYARLLAAAGETEQARAALTQAVDMFRRMGMAWDLACAEQALREP
jgi:tetratricopeptide (TPR) repeat protein